MLGLVHQEPHPVEREMLRHLGIADGITLGFRCGPDHVVQLSMDRYAPDVLRSRPGHAAHDQPRAPAADAHAADDAPCRPRSP